MAQVLLRGAKFFVLAAVAAEFIEGGAGLHAATVVKDVVVYSTDMCTLTVPV